MFFPGKQSAYVYSSLADFYADVNGYLANPNRTTSPITLDRFQVRYMNIPGADKPVQPLEVLYGGVYAQDEWRPHANMTVTAGLRLDVPFFQDTGFANPEADSLTFRDENSAAVQYQSGELPDASILWSPRVGLNWDVSGDGQTQIRGGTGIFTGRPAYVWISNQIGNTGVLTGFSTVRRHHRAAVPSRSQSLQAHRPRRQGRRPRRMSWRLPIPISSFRRSGAATLHWIAGCRST